MSAPSFPIAHYGSNFLRKYSTCLLGDLVLLKSGRFSSGVVNTTASETISLALRLLAPMVELIDSDVGPPYL